MAQVRVPTAPRPLITRAGPVATLLAGWVVRTLCALPARARERLAGGIAFLAWTLGIRRAVALDNLRHAFPELDERRRREICRGAYRNLALAALEAMTSHSVDDQALARLVDARTIGPIEEALRAGRGVLVATAHFGSWELFAEVMARRGYALSAVVRPLSGAFNAHVVENRQRAGVRLILQRGALSGMLKALRRGEVVAQLVDQALPVKAAVFVPFFGRPASVTPALAAAAQRTGAPVFVVMAAREGNGLRMFCEGPIPMPDTGDRRRDLEAHTARVTEVIEQYIRRYPEQWMWLHRRWKVQPPRG